MRKNTTSAAKANSTVRNSKATAAKTGNKSAAKGKSSSKKSMKETASKTIKDVFEEELKDIYGAEKQLMKALPEMAEAAYTEELKEAFENHLEETRRQVSRIEHIFQMLSLNREEKTCKAMKGLIEEGREIIEEFEEGVVRDCALIIGAQKIEHYEMAAYGSLCELAEVMGKHKVAELLDETLEEEEAADQMLTAIAESVNDEALQGEEDNGAEEEGEGEEEEEEEEVEA